MSQPGGIAVQRFVDAYAPDDDVRPPDRAFLDYGRAHAHPALVELWQRHGLGFYGTQRIALVDPGEWSPALTTWLGSSTASFPFAVTSFGHVYHYDHATGRVQCLDPHFQTNTLVGGDLVSFFNEHLPSKASHLSDLEGPRSGARAGLGELHPGEIYSFTTILALGGKVRPDNLTKGDGVAQLELIHREVAARHR